MFKTDEDIAKEFTGLIINKIIVNPSRISGHIDITCPEGAEHTGNGAQDFCDSWIIYDNGIIAFNNWYPENIYFLLVSSIKAFLKKA